MTIMPDYIVSTGDHIAEWVDDQGINAAELARRLDVSPKHVSELLSGKAPLSHALALDLERVTGLPAHIWLKYESTFRSDLARVGEQRQLASQFERVKDFPLAYLRKWGFISAASGDKVGTV